MESLKTLETNKNVYLIMDIHIGSNTGTVLHSVSDILSTCEDVCFLWEDMEEGAGG